MSTIQEAIQFATQRHGDQPYSGVLHTYHLKAVAQVMADFGHTDYVNQSSAWLHDVVEDTPTGIREVELLFGEDVSQHVWAVSGFGANRKERNADIKAKLWKFPRACRLKTADRIANMEASISDPVSGKPNIGMVGMYAKEHDDFVAMVASYIEPEMLDRINALSARLSELLL